MNKITKILKKYWGYEALKDKQIEAIQSCIDNIDTVVLLPTGYGKSMCYLIPPLVTKKVMIVISPLISLMEDQKTKLNQMKIPVATLHGNNINRDTEIQKILDGKILIVYCSPEFFVNDDMRIIKDFIKADKLHYLAVDECHCVSQWGHDFRDSYLKLKLFRLEFPNIPIMALTATATKDVVVDIIATLLNNSKNKIITTNFDRPNLYLKCVEILDTNLDTIYDKIAPFLEKYKDNKLIIYINNRKGCEDLSDLLSTKSYKSQAYHAGLSKQSREAIQTLFSTDLNIIISTVAFGMGIDLTIRCVLIIGAPNSVEDYYQMIGRAGRDGYLAETILFFNYKSIMIKKKMNQNKANKSEEDAIIVKTKDNNLTKMGKYFFSQICRRRFILEYFDQIPKFMCCTNCDNCCERIKIDYTDRIKQVVFDNTKKTKFHNIFNSNELDMLVEGQILCKIGKSYFNSNTLDNWIKILTINNKIDCIPDKYKIKI
jgi:ATP-dependent DNA helicase RecQ